MTKEQIQALAARLWLKANEAKQSDDWGCDSDNFHDVATPDAILSLLAEREADKALIAELQSFKTAYMEWHDKTEWVQTDKRFDVLVPWGKHRADVLKAYIEHLESRTLTVKLPESETGEAAEFGGGADVVMVQVVREVLAAAGITLVVGGE